MKWQRDKSVSKLRLCSYNRCFRIRYRCNSKQRKQDHQHMVIPMVCDSIQHVIEPSRDARSVKGLLSTLSESKQLPVEDSNRQHNNLFLQLATQEGRIQSHPTSVRSNSDRSVCIAPQPSNDQLLYNQNECTPTRLKSMEAVYSVSTSNTFAFCPGEDQLIEFNEGFYNTDISGVEASNLVFDDSNSSSSPSTSSISSNSGYIPRSIKQEVNRINSYSDSTTMEVGDYSTFQSHVKSIINTKKPVVFMDYLTYLFKLKPPLAYSTINSHCSMLNQLLFLKNQTDVPHDPFITRIMTGIHKLGPSSAKYNEIWDANLVFRYLSTINIYPKFTYNSLLGPVINAKEQRNTKSSDISILELTSLEAANLSRNAKSGDSVFIHDGTPLEVDDINKVVISTLSKSGIDVSKFK
ncbi:hypothetical protein ACTFIU_011190 [Dictyostelium citrinum]